MGKQIKPSLVKPPLGLRPKRISDKERLHEVNSAIVRYFDADLKIPIQWIEERNQLIDSLKSQHDW